MTRDEAIERLKTDIYKYADFTENPNENEFWMAFDMAIKALEQQTCEDAVSRQAVEDAIANTIVNGETLGYAVAYDILSDLPSVNTQPNVGHWIDDGQYADGHSQHAYRCSECGGNIIEYEPDDFCKFCGARMFEPQEGEE